MKAKGIQGNSRETLMRSNESQRNPRKPKETLMRSKEECIK